jgi:hypothetical protein
VPCSRSITPAIARPRRPPVEEPPRLSIAPPSALPRLSITPPSAPPRLSIAPVSAPVPDVDLACLSAALHIGLARASAWLALRSDVATARRDHARVSGVPVVDHGRARTPSDVHVANASASSMSFARASASLPVPGEVASDSRDHIRVSRMSVVDRCASASSDVHVAGAEWMPFARASASSDVHVVGAGRVAAAPSE